MKRSGGLTLAVVLVSLAFLGGCGHVGRLRAGGATIEYSNELEAVAREIAPWVAARREKSVAGGLYPYVLLKNANREDVLSFIADRLGVAEPGEYMRIAYREMLEMHGRDGVPAYNFNRLRLWTREELIDFLEAGGDLGDYSFNPATNKFSARGKVGLRIRSPEMAETMSAISVQPPGILPILVLPESGGTQVEAAKRKIDGYLRIMETLFTGAAFHEIAEIAMLAEIGICGERRRWFLEGVANYVAITGMRKFVSERAALDYLRSFDVRQYQALKRRAALAKWVWVPRQVTGSARTPEEAALTYARYAYATHEIMGLVERHGEDVIPRVFAELRSAKPGPVGPFGKPLVTIDVVLDAIEAVTGEDFRKRLAVYEESLLDDAD